jgi:hypothetical protein
MRLTVPVNYLLTYMALQPRFGQGVSLHLTQSRAPNALLSLFMPSAHLDFGLPWFRLPFGTALNRALCGRSSAPLIMCPKKTSFPTPLSSSRTIQRLHINDVREVPSVNHTMIDLVESARVVGGLSYRKIAKTVHILIVYFISLDFRFH